MLRKGWRDYDCCPSLYSLGMGAPGHWEDTFTSPEPWHIQSGIQRKGRAARVGTGWACSHQTGQQGGNLTDDLFLSLKLPAGSVAQWTWDLSSSTRDQIQVPCIARRILNHWTTNIISIITILQMTKLSPNHTACKGRDQDRNPGCVTLLLTLVLPGRSLQYFQRKELRGWQQRNRRSRK